MQLKYPSSLDKRGFYMSYEQLAILYDKLMAHAPYDEWVRFSEDIFKRYSASVNQIADLGCGTGEITIRLAKRGYEMTGIDISQEMLTVAAHKAASEKAEIEWLLQDVRKLEGLYEYDVAISFCD